MLDYLNLCANILVNLPYAVYFVDQQQKVRMWNWKAEEITGYTASDILGKPSKEGFLNKMSSKGVLESLADHFVSVEESALESEETERFLRHKNGSLVAVKMTEQFIFENGEAIGVLKTFVKQNGYVLDDTLVDTLTKMAVTDTLTGLHNRWYGQSMLKLRMQAVEEGKQYAVLFMDLDDFSKCNNAYGHEVGDMVLQSIANTVTDKVREDDIFCRWGGEEFVGIFAIERLTDIHSIGEKIRNLVSNSVVEVEGESVHVTASIGITAIQTSDTPKTVMDRADAYMYQGKQMGKNIVIADELVSSDEDSQSEQTQILA